MSFIRPHRAGLILLIALVAILQWAITYFPAEHDEVKTTELSPYWAQLEKKLQLKIAQQKKIADTIYPFNPNYLNDYRAYRLGLTDAEFDKLKVFRSQNKFVNSAKDFQQVTGVSDSLLQIIEVYFRFPDWVTQRNNPTLSVNSSTASTSLALRNTIIKEDLNSAKKEALMKVYGVGDKLSDRIVEFRNRIGGFAADFQLYDIYGLDSVVVKKVLERFTVTSPVLINSLDINGATYDELRALPYLNNFLARQIITYRQNHGPISNLEELTKIQDFPVERLRSLGLYLHVKKL